MVRAAKIPNNSFDAEDELDKDLAEELSRFRSPDAWNKVAQHLDLVWKVGRVSARKSQLQQQHEADDPCRHCHTGLRPA